MNGATGSDLPAAGEGPGDHPRLDHLKRLPLSLRPEPGDAPRPGPYGVEVEWVSLDFSTVP